MKSKIPYDVRQECLWIVRGQDRRIKAYNEMREEIINETSITGRGGNLPGKPVEAKAMRLLKLENYPEVKKMRAVEDAERLIGKDLNSDDIKAQLKEGILKNCKDRKKYPFSRLHLDGFSERSFYREKERFIYNVAKKLGSA